MLLNQSRRAYVNCDDRHLDAFMKYVTLSDGSDGRTKQVFYYGEGEKADYPHWQFKEEPKWCA